MYNRNSTAYMNSLRLYSKIKCNQKKQKANKRNHTRILAAILATLLAILLLASCASDNEKYHFKNNENALSSYHGFLYDLRSRKSLTGDEMTSVMSNWVELRDTVYNFISKDSAFHAHAYLPTTFFVIHDSIRTEMYRLAVGQDRTLKNVLRVKKATSIYNKEKDILTSSNAANTFFVSLDSLDICKADKGQTLVLYRKFLAQTDCDSIKSLGSLKTLLSAEDRLFRTFLSHINEYVGTPLADITKETELLCKGIYGNASRGTLDAKDVMVYMSMRTNRRLIQNTTACLESIKRHDRLTEAQQEAFFWMMIQPYVAIDDFGMAVLTPEQEKLLLGYADDIHRLERTHKLGTRSRTLSDMCHLILKLYISTL